MSSASPLLAAHDLGLTLPGGRCLFSGLSLSIAPGLTGMVGPNGVGKSLLLELLAGIREPTSGIVHRHVPVALLPQGGHQRPVAPGETVADRLGVGSRLAALERILAGGTNRADYALVGDTGWDLPRRAEARLAGVGLGHLELARPAAGLSGGELARVALAGVLVDDPDLLFLDEPTNDLDALSIRHLLDALEGWTGSALVVSHHRGLLRRADRILDFDPGGLRSYGGNYNAYRALRDGEVEAARAELDAAEAAKKRARRNASAARERQEKRSARGAGSRHDGSQPLMVMNARRETSQATTGRLGRQQARAVEDAEARVQAARLRVQDRDELRVDIPPAPLSSGRIVLRAEGVGWHAPDGTRVLDGVDLLIRGPERVAIAGPNGAGKSTLVRLLLGELVPTTGQVHLGVKDAEIARLDQAATLPAGATLVEAARAAHPDATEEHLRGALARYLFRGDAADVPVATLSGGERVRAALACALAGECSPSLLILDEPTNHLDLEGLAAVESAVRSFDGALLVISHDADFLEQVGVERSLVLPGPDDPRRAARGSPG